MSNKYPFSAYDKNLCLRPDIILWAALVFLVRPFAVMLLSVANRRDPMFLINLFYADRFAMILAAIAAIPAMFVVYAFIKRQPGADDRIRWIWTHGRELLLGSTLLNVVMLLVPVLTGLVPKPSLLTWGELAACGYIIYHLFSAQRVRDTFEDFPDPSPKGDGAAR